MNGPAERARAGAHAQAGQRCHSGPARSRPSAPARRRTTRRRTTVMDPTTIYGISKLAGERLVRLVPPALRRGRAQPALSGPHQLEDAARRRHHRLCDRDLVCGARRRTIHLFPASREHLADDLHAGCLARNAGIDGGAGREYPHPLGLQRRWSSVSVRANWRSRSRRQLPQFKVSYQPDSRQAIADSWPHSVDDSAAHTDWGWRAAIGLEQMVADMLTHIAVAPPALTQVA